MVVLYPEWDNRVSAKYGAMGGSVSLGGKRDVGGAGLSQGCWYLGEIVEVCIGLGITTLGVMRRRVKMF